MVFLRWSCWELARNTLNVNSYSEVSYVVLRSKQ